MTPRQRDVLQRRIEMALLWQGIKDSNTESYRCANARRAASAVLDELDHSFMDAPAQRRAVENIITKIERTA